MMSPLIRASVCASVLLLLSSSVTAADLDLYREFRLGNSTADVIARAGLINRDVKTMHQRPAVLQEILWRPPYVPGGVMSGRDSVRGVVFSFMNDQLFRIVVDYETTRTAGMTPADMIASLVGVYGPVTPLRAPAPAPRRPATYTTDMSAPIANWSKGDAQVVLQQHAQSGRFGLIIAAVSVDHQAQRAQADAEALDVKEGPAREAAQAKARADAAAKAAEAARTANKAAFKP